MKSGRENDSGGVKAWVVSVHMGLGHMRAAYPLRDLANGEIIVDGSETFCKPDEYNLWKRLRQIYYFMSRAENIPLVGGLIMKILHMVEQIPAYYPRRDLSAPDWSVRYLRKLIKKRGMSSSLIETVKDSGIPVVSTFYGSAVAVDAMAPDKEDNYLVICDSDFHRVWVADKPKKSKIKYLAPCTRVKKRLLSYGVPEENIFLTGFPLPKENIGSPEKLEILKEDLFARLLRLDPDKHFFNIHEKTVEYYLGKTVPKHIPEKHFVLTFAVGGAGSQAYLAKRILKSLRARIIAGDIKINLSAGIRKDVYLQFKEYVSLLRLPESCHGSVNIIYGESLYRYFDMFNSALRMTDVLWTKPSELSFYCALGIPIIMAPTIGPHEEQNRTWLQEIHSGVKPGGSVDLTDEWLFDLRHNGVLAEAAWDGFLKGRKLGVYKIEELLKHGKLSGGNSPLER
jgi:hypothetical protein